MTPLLAAPLPVRNAAVHGALSVAGRLALAMIRAHSQIWHAVPMKTSYLLAAILAISVIGALIASRAMKTGALLAVAALAVLGLLNLLGVLR